MQLGTIRLGRMGANVVRRLLRAGHEGAVAAEDLGDFAARPAPPRAVWLMLPAALTGP